MRFTRLVEKKLPGASFPSPAPTIRRGIGEFSLTAPFQLEKNLQHAPHVVAAGMPLLLGLRETKKYFSLTMSKTVLSILGAYQKSLKNV